MFFNDKRFRELAWHCATAIYRIINLEVRMSEVSDQITAVNTQLDKVYGEVSTLPAKISDLETALAASGATDQATLDALAALKANAQRLDDVVPDAPVVEDPAPADPAPVDPAV